MSQMDYSSLFSCPRCGLPGAIYVLKVSSAQVVIKQRCPRHGGRVFKLPLMQKDQYIHLIRDNVFRCFKCGQEAVVNFMKPSGPWALIRCSCPVHGTMTTQKIWNPIYTEITQMPSEQLPQPIQQPEPTQQPHGQPQPIQQQISSTDTAKYCAECGSTIEEGENYCASCGAKIQ